MTALAQNKGQKERNIKRLSLPLAAGVHAYQGGIACVNLATGQAVQGQASPNLIRVGIFAEEIDNSLGVTTLLVSVELDYEIVAKWLVNDTVNPVTSAMLLQDCYILDDQTVTANPNGRSVAGRVWGVDASLGVCVQNLFGTPDQASQAPVVHQARAVITSLAAYTAAGGTLTANAVGLIGAQDGVTLVAGDVVLLPTDKATAAKDAGPYVVVNPGAAGAKFVLTRPSWYPTGGVELSGQIIVIGAEGTLYGGSEWKSLVAAATFVVDTTDGAWYPRFQTVTTVAMTAGVSPANNTLYVAPNAQAYALPITPGGTQGILRISTQTAGKPTASSIVVTSSSNTDTSNVKINVINF
jgi:hypothetical protein